MTNLSHDLTVFDRTIKASVKASSKTQDDLRADIGLLSKIE